MGGFIAEDSLISSVENDEIVLKFPISVLADPFPPNYSHLESNIKFLVFELSIMNKKKCQDLQIEEITHLQMFYS